MEKLMVINEVLQTLRTDISTLEASKRRLDDRLKTKDQLTKALAALKTQYDKEQRDVQKLNTLSLTNLWFSLTGGKGDKLELEEREAYDAKIKWDTCQTRLAAVEEDIEKLVFQIQRLSKAPEAYQEKLHEKLTWIENHIPTCIEEIKGIETKSLLHQQNIKEIEEGIAALVKVKTLTHNVCVLLDEAKSWSTFDLVSDSIIASVVKHDKLREVKKAVDLLNHEIEFLKQELSDIKIHKVAAVDFSHYAFIDTWLDNIFTDFSVHHKINDIITNIKHYQDNLMALEKELMQYLETEKNNCKTWDLKWEDWIFSFKET